MPVISGFYDDSGNPSLTIQLSGVADHAAMPDGLEFDGLLDTGFMGFLSVPVTRALPLGLPLSGTTPMILADGSLHQRLTAWGCVTVGGRALWGGVVLDPTSEELLLGLEFLQIFNFALLLTGSEVLLFEQDDHWAERFCCLTKSATARLPT
jgi:predicted aspartyl protease